MKALATIVEGLDVSTAKEIAGKKNPASTRDFQSTKQSLLKLSSVTKLTDLFNVMQDILRTEKREMKSDFRSAEKAATCPYVTKSAQQIKRYRIWMLSDEVKLLTARKHNYGGRKGNRLYRQSTDELRHIMENSWAYARLHRRGLEATQRVIDWMEEHLQDEIQQYNDGIISLGKLAGMVPKRIRPPVQKIDSGTKMTQAKPRKRPEQNHENEPSKATKTTQYLSAILKPSINTPVVGFFVCGKQEDTPPQYHRTSEKEIDKTLGEGYEIYKKSIKGLKRLNGGKNVQHPQ